MHSSPEPEDCAAPEPPAVGHETPEPGGGKVIQVPARAMPPPARVAPQATAAAGASEEEKKKKALEWKRKAASRRMKAGRVEPNEDFLPVFTPRRMPDPAPVFDQDPMLQPVPSESRAPSGSGRWLLATGGVLAVLLLLRMGTQLWESAGLMPPEAPPQEPPDPEGVDPAPAAKRLVEAFFVAKTPEEKTSLVRGGDAMLGVMREYYAAHPDEPAPFRCDPDIIFGEADMGRFVIIFGTDGGKRRHITAVESTPEGGRLDWRVLTGSGDMPWADWIRQRPARRISQRIVASRDDYYGGRFVDQERWLCVKAADITGNWTVWGYAERDSPTGEYLRKNLRPRAGTKRFTGVFEFPALPNIPEGGAPQAFLHSVEGSWIDRSIGKTAPASAVNAGGD